MLSRRFGVVNSLFVMDPITLVRSSPLLRSCGFTDADVDSDESRWREASQRIASALRFDGDMTPAQRTRAFHYYLPIVMWIQRLKERRMEDGPLMLGMSAPQGCGKSTLVECLLDVFGQMGMKAACVSIDDFYLTNAEQRRLAAQYKDNPLLQCRGNALTHDVQLGTDTLRKLKGLNGAGSVAVPRYDKSAFGGKGDRMAPGDWMPVEGPLDLILFEGWMLGFRAVDDESVMSVDSHLLPINEALKGYKSAWDAFVDAWLVIKVADPAWVGKWRLEAEQKMKKSGKPGMSDAEVQAFVNCYMPAYKAYLPELYSKGPATVTPGKCLIIEVDDQRSPIQEQPEQIE